MTKKTTKVGEALEDNSFMKQCNNQHHTQLEEELRVTQDTLIQMTRQRNELFEQLHKYTGIKSQTRMLLGAIYDKLFAAAENVNKPIRQVSAPNITEITTIDDRRALEDILLAYDSASLTEKRLVGGFFRRSVSKLAKSMLLLFVRASRFFAKAIWHFYKRTKLAIS
jgi:hypothetical protein